MCHKCEEIDLKVKHYRNLANLVQDPATVDGLHKLIEDLDAAKAKIHPTLGTK